MANRHVGECPPNSQMAYYAQDEYQKVMDKGIKAGTVQLFHLLIPIKNSCLFMIVLPFLFMLHLPPEGKAQWANKTMLTLWMASPNTPNFVSSFLWLFFSFILVPQQSTKQKRRKQTTLQLITRAQHPGHCRDRHYHDG